MNAADEAFEVQTFGATQEIVNTEGRRGCLAPIVVHRGVAYAFTVLDGPAGHEPAPLAIEALIEGAWVVLQPLSVDASLSAPEVQVSRWRVPEQAQAFRPATGWYSGAETPATLPATARRLPGGDIDGFWGPAIQRGDDLACVFISYANTPWASLLPPMPALEGHTGERWHLLQFVQGGAGSSEDGVLIQFGHWSMHDDVIDLRVLETVGS